MVTSWGNPSNVDLRLVCQIAKGICVASGVYETRVRRHETKVPLVEQRLRAISARTPAIVESALMGIGKELDPDYRERLLMSRKALFGDPQISAPGVPLILFHGTPQWEQGNQDCKNEW